MDLIAKLFGKGKITNRRGYLSGFDKDQVRARWAKIEELRAVAKPSALREAVVEADKLIDFSLDKIYPGKESAAERLKEAKELFASNRESYESLWYAHKIRNEMVHAVGFELPSTEAKNILDFYKLALDVLGVL